MVRSSRLRISFYLTPANVIQWNSQTLRWHIDFYCFLLWPFVETYWLAAVSLYTLIPNAKDLPLQVDANGEPQLNWIEERVFMEKTQMFGKTLYYQGDLSYFESVNMETLKNGFNRLSDYGILMIKRPTSAKERTKVALHPDFIPVRGADGHVIADGALWDMVEHIGTFRREGKNRRDNATGKPLLNWDSITTQFSTVNLPTLTAQCLPTFAFNSLVPCPPLCRGCCKLTRAGKGTFTKPGTQKNWRRSTKIINIQPSSARFLGTLIKTDSLEVTQPTCIIQCSPHFALYIVLKSVVAMALTTLLFLFAAFFSSLLFLMMGRLCAL